jgi:IS6 family transposase
MGTKFGPEIRKRAYGRHHIWRGLQWHADETYESVNSIRCYLWRAVDHCGQLIDFRLTALRNAKEARAFMRQADETVRCYRPLTIMTEKAHNYSRVIGEINCDCGPEEAIRDVNRKHLNNSIEVDHGALIQLLLPKRGFRSLSCAKNTLKGIETFRTIKKGHFANNPTGILNEIAFVSELFQNVA